MAGRIFQIGAPDLLFELGIPKIIPFKEIDFNEQQVQTFMTGDKHFICVAHQLADF